jgi:hypothetical protein
VSRRGFALLLRPAASVFVSRCVVQPRSALHAASYARPPSPPGEPLEPASFPADLALTADTDVIHGRSVRLWRRQDAYQRVTVAVDAETDRECGGAKAQAITLGHGTERSTSPALRHCEDRSSTPLNPAAVPLSVTDEFNEEGTGFVPVMTWSVEAMDLGPVVSVM